METALQHAGRAVAEAQVSRATSTVNEETAELMIMVEPFPTEGGRIYDQLKQSFDEVLGDERQALFAAAYGATFDNLHNGMGTTRRELTLNLIPVSTITGLGNIYEIKDKTTNSNGNTSSGTSRVDWASVEKKLGPLNQFLPLEEPVIESKIVAEPEGPIREDRE